MPARHPKGAAHASFAQQFPGPAPVHRPGVVLVLLDDRDHLHRHRRPAPGTSGRSRHASAGPADARRPARPATTGGPDATPRSPRRLSHRCVGRRAGRADQRAVALARQLHPALYRRSAHWRLSGLGDVLPLRRAGSGERCLQGSRHGLRDRRWCAGGADRANARPYGARSRWRAFRRHLSVDRQFGGAGVHGLGRAAVDLGKAGDPGRYGSGQLAGAASTADHSRRGADHRCWTRPDDPGDERHAPGDAWRRSGSARQRPGHSVAHARHVPPGVRRRAAGGPLRLPTGRLPWRRTADRQRGGRPARRQPLALPAQQLPARHRLEPHARRRHHPAGPGPRAG